jgi:CRP/FNR family transcriptional regulator, nitrogen oxide reductase regulator
VADALFAKPIALFAALDAAALRDVRASSRIKPLAAGSAYFREGDPANAFFVLERGSVKLTQLTPEGHQVVLRLIGPGDAFGGVAAFGGATYPVTAEAVTDASALEWPAVSARPRSADRYLLELTIAPAPDTVADGDDVAFTAP